MIRVNLGRKIKQKSNAVGGKASLSDIINKLKGGTKGGEASGDTFDFRNSTILKVIILAAILYGADFFIENEKAKKMTVLKAEQNTLQAEITRLTAEVEKSRGYETVKQQLEQHEQTVRTKLETISKLLANRSGPSKMLIQIAQSIPSDVWITEMKVTEEAISIAGGTPGYSQVSDFLKSLSESSFLHDPRISGIEENISAAKDQLFQSFEISASRRRLQ